MPQSRTLTAMPAQIVNAALEESAHVVGWSVLSGSHMELIGAVLDGMCEAGIGDILSSPAASFPMQTRPGSKPSASPASTRRAISS